MATFTFKGNQIGEALQFDGQSGTTNVEIGRVWFAATDTVTMTTTPTAFDATGAFVGGAGAILSLTVTTADGRVTTFSGPTNPLDVDPDQGKQGADFFYISESPAPGMGGAYAGLQLEKIVVSDVPLTAGATVSFGNTTGFTSTAITNPPPPPSPTGGGTPGDDVLIGTAAANTINGMAGNDIVRGLGGNDSINGGDGNDILDGGIGADRLTGGAGNDRMLGGQGRDQMFGGQGNDLLDGGAHADLLTGGFGGDSFVFGAGDRVTDFNGLEGDQIVFNAARGVTEADLTISTTAAGTVVSYAGVAMTLNGYFGPLEAGNQIMFDYVPSQDFL
ncbi:MAG: calcium-binding protein [Paracoccaceae bacterium]